MTEEIRLKLQATGLTDAQIEEKVQAKVQELSGLISAEGALHIIANEVGVTTSEPEKMTIKSIESGAMDINFDAKVLDIYEKRTFKRKDGTGTVQTLFIGDTSGKIRFVCWDTATAMISTVQVGDTIRVSGAYAKDGRGNVEVHCGARANIERNPEGVSIDIPVSVIERIDIKDAMPGDNKVEFLASIVQFYDTRFFDQCPECRKRVTDGNCEVHGTVEPAVSYVTNVVLDDGTGTMRAVFWKSQTNQLCGKSEEEMVSLREGSFEDVRLSLLGEQVVIVGVVKENSMFNRNELVVNRVQRAEPTTE
jgi:replication factor A1